MSGSVFVNSGNWFVFESEDIVVKIGCFVCFWIYKVGDFLGFWSYFWLNSGNSGGGRNWVICFFFIFCKNYYCEGDKKVFVYNYVKDIVVLFYIGWWK